MQDVSLSRYLKAKRSVDDRSLNRRVWATFLERLQGRSSPTGHISILEVASGIGSTVPRILDALSWNQIESVNYTLVDYDPSLTETAKARLPEWGRSAGFEVKMGTDVIVFAREGAKAIIELVCEDAFEYLDQQRETAFDAVIAQAWLDIVNLESALSLIFQILPRGSLFYAPIHFDGATRFLPLLDETLDEKIVQLYHRSMDERRTDLGPAGGSNTGSRLLTEVPALNAEITSAGASDWIVRPLSGGEYPHDESYFLNHILHFFEEALMDVPQLETDRLRTWIRKRRAQVDRGELLYLAHQFDVLATAH